MALNAMGALLAAIEVGAPADAVLDGLAGFEGVRRRFELVGTAAGVRVFDDYAHHPTEVRATLSAVRTVPEQSGGRSIVVFPAAFVFADTDFRAEFGQALDGADEVFVLDVYGAREQPIAGVSGASVAEHVSVPGALPAGLLRGRRAGGRGGRAGRRRRHDGRRRRHHARHGDPRRRCASRPTAVRRRPVAMTEPTDEPSERRSEDAARNRSAAPEPRGRLPAAAADFEGPRRRARREREERRAAQARATAIEQARREAKRRALGKPAGDAQARRAGRCRGLKVLMWSALVA